MKQQLIRTCEIWALVTGMCLLVTGIGISLTGDIRIILPIGIVYVGIGFLGTFLVMMNRTYVKK